jgi:hypothetical protein
MNIQLSIPLKSIEIIKGYAATRLNSLFVLITFPLYTQINYTSLLVFPHPILNEEINYLGFHMRMIVALLTLPSLRILDL